MRNETNKKKLMIYENVHNENVPNENEMGGGRGRE